MVVSLATPPPIIPMYAPYGNAIFGETVYGWPPKVYVSTTLTVSPVPGQSGVYDSLFVNWATPGGNWNEQKLMRSSYGIPVSTFVNDGVVLIDETAAPYSTSFVDTGIPPGAPPGTSSGLKSGRFYYYALFVFDTDVGEWLFAAGAQGLCLTDFGFVNNFISWTPDWYLELDAVQDPADPLVRFYELLGFESNWIRSEIETLFTLSSPEYISGALLPYLGGNVGIGYEPALGMTRSRVLVENAVGLYHIKGTLEGVEETASAFSGYSCETTISPNLEIQLDDAAFSRSIGHWTPQNNGTTIQLVNSLITYGMPPQHAAYAPLQGNPGLSSGLMTVDNVTGYLPSDGNENVALITAISQYSWTNNLATQYVPGGRNHPALACDYDHNQFLLFGGQLQSPGAPWLNDTWLWTGSVWQRLNPATAPTALRNPVMCYDPQYHTVILVGINGSTGSMETWSWNQTNWSRTGATNSINRSYTLCPGKFYGTPFLWLVGVNTSGVMQFLVYTPNAWSSAGNTPFSNWSNQAAAYDWSTGLMTVVGGYGTNTPSFFRTYLWDGNAWTYAGDTGTTGPAVGGGGTMTWNGAANHVQYLDTNNVLWQYTRSTNTWAKVTGTGTAHPSPTPARAGATMMFNNHDNTVVLYGGITGVGYYQGDTWIYTNSTITWTLNPAATSPPPRTYGAMAYNAGSTNVGLFGGLSPNSVLLGDLWTWNGTAWALANPATSPPPRYQATVCNTTTNLLYMYGGLGADASGNPLILNDMWQWNGTTWTQVTTTGGPTTGRYGHMMVWDSTASVLVIFGGQSPRGTYLNDTWHFNPSTNAWTQQSPATSPPVRANAAFTFASGGTSVLFGGQNASGPLGGTWLYSSTPTPSWTQVVYAPAFPTPPSARHSAATAYVPSLGMFVFGGTDASGNNLNDAWYFNLTLNAWTSFPLSTPEPFPRTAGMAVYNSTASTVVFYGGARGGSILGDTWTFLLHNNPFAVTECDNTNAMALGIPIAQLPQQATPPPPNWYIFSAYFQPTPNATTLTRSFQTQLDWYDVNGGRILPSTTGTAVTEVVGQWVRASVAAHPPTGACYVGRTIQSVQSLSGGPGSNDMHLMDACQLEINNQAATPTPTAWTPPRDIQINLYPNRQNLAVNTQALIGGSAPYETAVQTSLPVIYWPLNDAAGSANASELISGRTAAPSGGVTFGAADPWGNPGAVHLDGTGMLLDSGSSAMGVFSIECWYQSTVATGGFAGAQQVTPAVNSPSMDIAATHLYGYSYPGATYTEAAHASNDGLWHHAVWAVDVANHATLYRDGVLVASGAGAVSNTTTSVWHIGNTATNGHLTGSLAHLAIYNRALTAAEVANHAAYGPTQGTYGWSATAGTIATRMGGTVPWPQNTRGGFQLTASGTNAGIQTIPIPIAQGFIGDDIGSSSLLGDLEVTPAATFVASFYVMAATAITGNWTITFTWRNASGATVGTSVFPATGGFHEVSNQFTRFATPPVAPPVVAPPTGPVTSFIVALKGSGLTSGSVHYMAAPLIEPASGLLPFFDGNYTPAPDYMFEGTPNQSYSDYYPNLGTRMSRLMTVIPNYIPIGSTFSIYVGQAAFSNTGLPY
jgi:hypothetical protein